MYARALLLIIAALLVTAAPASANPDGDVFIELLDAPDPVTAGGLITYTITVASNGPGPAAAVRLENPVPAGTTAVSAATSDPDGVCALVIGATTAFTCDFGTVIEGELVIVVLVVRTTTSTKSPVTNVATITADDDSVPGNNTATATTTIDPPPPPPPAAEADLRLTKTDTPDPVGVGGMITYSLTVTNAGPDGAAGVELVDDLPATTTLVSAGSSQGACSGSDPVSCQLGTLATGATATVTIVAEASAPGSPLNVAFVFAASPSDPATANNSAIATTTVASGLPAPSPSPSPPQPSPPTAAPPRASGGPGTPTLSAGPDVVPPGRVAGVRATVGNRTVVVRWRSPSDSDFQRVEVARSSAGAGRRVVYSGNGEEFADRGVRNGVRYLYELRSFDRNGNASAGVRFAAIPKALLLFSPQPNARVSAAPMLRWITVSGASYYNVQLYRGPRKVLSAWPRANRLKLLLRWTFGGRGQRLVPGEYHWFVWPGRGPRSRSSYGPLLGRSSFVIVAPNR